MDSHLLLAYSENSEALQENPKTESGNPTQARKCNPNYGIYFAPFSDRTSAFGVLSGFGFRYSDLTFTAEKASPDAHGVPRASTWPSGCSSPARALARYAL